MGEPEGHSLRVALLSPRDWPEVRRGTERFTRELAAGLLRHGHRPQLITSHRGAPSRSVEDGLPVLRLPRAPERHLARRFEAPLTHVPLSYLALVRGRFDLAHAMFPADALAAARWGRRRGKPSVLSYMGIPEPEWLAAQRGRRAIMARAVERCDAVVVLSHHAAAAFAASFGREPRVIAPGVDLGTFTPRGGRDPRPTIVCSAAVQEPRKHVALLVRALALVRRRHPETTLVLSRPRGGQRARAAGVELDAPGVVLRDLDERSALAEAYSRAWAVALPAEKEAFGLVLAEALACGTPVVGYRGGGIPEVVDRPGIGRLFDSLEPEPLADALLECFELAQQDVTVAACRGRAEELSTEACVTAYLQLYRELGA